MSQGVRWTPGYRIIRTLYPPVALFEDIADPADWELLVSAEAKLNPRIRDEIGNLALVPADRRINGDTARSLWGRSYTYRLTTRVVSRTGPMVSGIAAIVLRSLWPRRRTISSASCERPTNRRLMRISAC